ncbi:hypothetical protein [Streptomyces diastaticus]
MTTPTSPALQWRLYDGGEWRWGREHAPAGPCPSCCCGGPSACPDCGARRHHEPVEGAGPDVPHETFCQREHVNEYGDAMESREVAWRP